MPLAPQNLYIPGLGLHPRLYVPRRRWYCHVRSSPESLTFVAVSEESVCLRSLVKWHWKEGQKSS